MTRPATNENGPRARANATRGHGKGNLHSNDRPGGPEAQEAGLVARIVADVLALERLLPEAAR